MTEGPLTLSGGSPQCEDQMEGTDSHHEEHEDHSCDASGDSGTNQQRGDDHADDGANEELPSVSDEEVVQEPIELTEVLDRAGPLSVLCAGAI